MRGVTTHLTACRKICIAEDYHKIAHKLKLVHEIRGGDQRTEVCFLKGTSNLTFFRVGMNFLFNVSEVLSCAFQSEV